jgi:putative PIN family toxin of toxin-antitoxin system
MLGDGVYAIIPLVVIVLDTSVFVSALLGPRGASREVLSACLMRRLHPLMGAALFAEYEALLSRSTLFEKSHLDPAKRESLLNGFLNVCQWTNIYYGWRPNLRDEGDNHLIELAVAGGAAAIVTKNLRDLRSGELHFPGLRILDPAGLLKEIS